MANIDKIAMDYIQATAQTAKKRKSRKALFNTYESLRAKYTAEKEIVKEITDEGAALQKKYEDHKKKMDTHHAKMLDIRSKLMEMDDSGSSYFEYDPNPESPVTEDDFEEDVDFPE